MKAIEIDGVSKKYSSLYALGPGFSCSINHGVNTVLLGRNGAGKTTLMNVITGIVNYDSGTIRIRGKKNTLPASREGLRYFPDNFGVPRYSTIEDIINEYSYYGGDVNYEDVFEVAEEFECAHILEKIFFKCSKGQVRLLLLSMILSGQPEIIILDEPMESLDPVSISLVRNRIFSLTKSGSTILQSTHRIHEAEVQQGEYIIIDQGQFKAAGRVNSLSNCFVSPSSLVSLINNQCIVAEGNRNVVYAKEDNIPERVQAASRPATLEDFFLATIGNQ